MLESPDGRVVAIEQAQRVADRIAIAPIDELWSSRPEHSSGFETRPLTP